MADEETLKTCAHEGCSCLMQEEEDFCSEHCEGAGSEASCACGHLACASHAETA